MAALILADWLRAQHAAGARTFSLMVVMPDGETARMIILGLDKVTDSNSAWDIDGNQCRPAEITADDLEQIWEA